MRGKVLKDWSKVRYDPRTGMPVKEDKAKIMAALQYFMSNPLMKAQEIKSAMLKVQEFSTTEDFPTSVLQVLEKYHLTTAYDVGYQSIFQINDFTGSNRNGFEISDVQSGLTFAKTKEGEKIDVYQMSGSKATVTFDYYGGALGWHRRLFEDQEYWALEDNAIEFRNKSMAKMASAYYALIEAIAATRDIAWTAPVPSALATSDNNYVANRDAQTMNAAALNIIDAVKGKGYGIDPQNVSFVVLCPIALKGRLRRALSLMLQPVTGSQPQVDFNFQIIATTMLSSSSYYYVALPKLKAKGGTRMNLRIFTAFDQLSYTDVSAGWMRFGGAIGDQEQFCRCSIA